MIRFFCAGRHSREYVGFLGDVEKSRICHMLQLGAQHDPRAVYSDLFADVLRDQFVVTGENLDSDAIRPQRGDRVFDSFNRRIEEREESGKRKVTLILTLPTLGALNLAIGYGKDAQTVRAEPAERFSTSLAF